ncbi:MAG: hypothetical protein COU72_03450 [Parcubacteria group bacterium CG10_big_fil_rev_8_21_14_0_10_41_35]|nr:MAG: hypothetical protein COU72_03450 [Parcubacteria group bacterium CG10_big_fil_rev_8_21_14_0_10_41_35]
MRANWKPRHTARILGGQNPKKKNVLSILEKTGRAQIRKARNIFSFGGCRVKRGGGGAIIRTYDSVSSYHALRACDIICFENRCEFGTIQTLS